MKIRKKLAYRPVTKVFLFLSGRMLVFDSRGIIQQKLPILRAGHVSVEILEIKAASSPLRIMLVLKYFDISSGAGTRRAKEMSGHAPPSNFFY